MATSTGYPGRSPWSTSWERTWPPDEFAAFAEAWPDLVDGYGGNAEGHRHETERQLRTYAEIGSNPLQVAHGRLSEFLEFARNRSVDPRTGNARAFYAAELGRTGRSVRWPPGFDDPCWCGSGATYSQCCGSIVAQ